MLSPSVPLSPNLHMFSNFKVSQDVLNAIGVCEDIEERIDRKK